MIKYFLVAVLFFSILKPQKLNDENICTIKFDLAKSKNLQQLPLNEIIVEIGKTFLGTKYVGGILDLPESENLVINFELLDCVSFYENSLAISFAIKKGNFNFEGFKNELKNIRYRDGIINGYSSRLHYTTDYFFDNDKRNNFKVVTEKIIDKIYLEKIKQPINFMSQNKNLYKNISDEKIFSEIKKIEENINSRLINFIPKKFIDKADLKNGDIIGITAKIKGLDVSHTGIVVLEKGEARLLHASQKNLKVEITNESLKNYLLKNSTQTGIIVARVTN